VAGSNPTNGGLQDPAVSIETKAAAVFELHETLFSKENKRDRFFFVTHDYYLSRYLTLA
jgi:hypothetical protein